ncbi:hypothetical protein [Roseimicrobium gellanilyticum]|nr:hypothetical protein [Roseimicrobium gellanilyticum]
MLIALWWEENWRGQKLWEESCARLRAAGEPVEIADIIPPMIPDEENVAAAPIFAELFGDPEAARLPKISRSLPTQVGKAIQSGNRGISPDDLTVLEEYRNDLRERFPRDVPDTAMSAADEILHYLKRWDVDYQEMLSALERPRCRWPLDYESGVKMDSPHLVPLVGFTNFMRLRLLALAANDDGEQYTRNLVAMMKLDRTIGERPQSWLAQLVSNAMATVTFNTWQQTLARVHLNDEQLKLLQDEVSKYSLESVRLALQNEHVIGAETFRKLSGAEMVEWMDELDWMPSANGKAMQEIKRGVFRAGMLLRPQGWTLAEAALGQDFSFDEELPCVDPVRGVIDAARVESSRLKGEQLKSSLSWFSMGRHAQNLATFSSLMERTSRVHAQARLALLWCAIERCRLRHGKLPPSTEALVPEFLAALPVDVMSGGAIRFSPKQGDSYVLYSSSWNRGHIRKSSTDGPAKDDWTWPSEPTLLKTEAEGKSEPGSTTGRKR